MQHVSSNLNSKIENLMYMGHIRSYLHTYCFLRVVQGFYYHQIEAFKEQPLSEKHIHLFWKTGNSDSNKTKSMLENSTRQ